MSDWSGVFHIINRTAEAVPLLVVPSLRMVYGAIPARLGFSVRYLQAMAVIYCLKNISRNLFHNDVYLYYLSTILTFLFLSTNYFKLFEYKHIKKLILITQMIFILVVIIEMLWINNVLIDINSYSQGVCSCVLIILALLHLSEISRLQVSLMKQPEFYLSISVLVYFSYTIITYVATTIIYNSGYDVATTIRLDRIISAPDALLYAVHMGLLAWMFSFFPLSINPRRALPRWLHYSCWRQRPYKLLGNKILLSESTISSP